VTLVDVRKYMEQVRSYVEAGVGTLTPARAREVARQAVSGEGLGQASQLARDLLEWSRRNREQLMELVRGEIAKQVSALGLVTQDDLDALRKRVRDLERSAPRGASGADRPATGTKRRGASSSAGPGRRRKTDRSAKSTSSAKTSTTGRAARTAPSARASAATRTTGSRRASVKVPSAAKRSSARPRSRATAENAGAGSEPASGPSGRSGGSSHSG
jgi:polyhydroxyalkanoate synthesis regulator phasin